MKALTIKQPWASAIISGIKTVENRTWYTHYTGRLLIHAGNSRDYVPVHMLPLLQALLPFEDLPYGAIIGTVNLVDVIDMNDNLKDNPFAFGPICWILKKPVEYSRPISCKGHLGLWEFMEVSDE